MLSVCLPKYMASCTLSVQRGIVSSGITMIPYLSCVIRSKLHTMSSLCCGDILNCLGGIVLHYYILSLPQASVDDGERQSCTGTDFNRQSLKTLRALSEQYELMVQWPKGMQKGADCDIIV